MSASSPSSPRTADGNSPRSKQARDRELAEQAERERELTQRVESRERELAELTERERELAALAESRERELAELATRAHELSELTASRERNLADLTERHQGDLRRLEELNERLREEVDSYAPRRCRRNRSLLKSCRRATSSSSNSTSATS